MTTSLNFSVGDSDKNNSKSDKKDSASAHFYRSNS